MIYLTSDHHFGHARIIELCNRPFSSVEEMNEEMIRRWNEVVIDDDTVYHLGDLSMGQADENITMTARLNGRKFLLPGNHDKLFSHRSQEFQARWRPFYEDAGWRITMEQWDLRGYTLCHFPRISTDPTDERHDDRYLDLRPDDDGTILIHGHTHSHAATSPARPRQYHVGVDAHDFYPVPITTIDEEML